LPGVDTREKKGYTVLSEELFMNETKTLALAGAGKLAEIIAQAYTDGLLPGYRITGVMSRSKDKAELLADKINKASWNSPSSCAVCPGVKELLNLRPDFIVEAASPSALKELALPALENGSSIVALSIGAFADESFYGQVTRTAETHGTRVYIVSGAVGGFDVLRTVALMGTCSASIDTEKGPDSLKGTPVYEEALQTGKKKVFEGNAKEAIALFPTKVNVAVASSLASVGPGDMRVSVTSTPGFVGDDHRIEIRSDEVRAVIDVYSKTAKIAAWSVVNTLRNISSPIVFC
jgi:aspartate dehydrogenase